MERQPGDFRVHSALVRADRASQPGAAEIRYSALYIILVALSGFLAFTVVGFFGFTNDPPLLKDLAVGDSWPIFAWSVFLLVSLQDTLLHGQVPRRRHIAALLVTLVAAALAGAIVYARVLLPLLPPVPYLRYCGPCRYVSTVLQQQQGFVIAALGLLVLAIVLLTRTAVGEALARLILHPVPLWPQLSFASMWGAAASAYLTGRFLHLQSAEQSGNTRQTVLIGAFELGAALFWGALALVAILAATVGVSTASDSPEKSLARSHLRRSAAWYLRRGPSSWNCFPLLPRSCCSCSPCSMHCCG